MYNAMVDFVLLAAILREVVVIGASLPCETGA
jgi:hypothetical protein